MKKINLRIKHLIVIILIFVIFLLFGKMMGRIGLIQRGNNVNTYTSEKKLLKIELIQNENFSGDISFISAIETDRYSRILNSLENGRKIFFTGFIPKTGVIEGEYKLSIYSGDDCLVIFEIVNDDYVYNETNNCFLKVPNILSDIRSALFLEYLRNR